MHRLKRCKLVKRPLAPSEHIAGFIGVGLGGFLLFLLGFFFPHFRQPVAYGFMIHKDGP